MRKPVLVSGIQPTGRLHLGNYLGMLKNAIELQNSGKYDCYYFLADLHSLTESTSREEKAKQILELGVDLLALGLDPKKSVLFQQSQIPAHSELSWILTTIVPLGELYRMTQFKDKTSKETSSNPEQRTSNAGLLTYPVLMASDIILYGAKFVPVGEDQVQHLELTRTLARKFNAKYGETFTEPQPILTRAARIMSLGNPDRKMSKSQAETCLFLDDSLEEILQKIKRAVTDSGSEIKFDKKNKPAISNLLTIYSEISGKSIVGLEKEYEGKRYSEFKEHLAETIIVHLEKYWERKKKLLGRPGTIKSVLKNGSDKAQKIAGKKITEVKKKIGLLL